MPEKIFPPNHRHLGRNSGRSAEAGSGDTGIVAQRNAILWADSGGRLPDVLDGKLSLYLGGIGTVFECLLIITSVRYFFIVRFFVGNITQVRWKINIYIYLNCFHFLD